MLHPLAIGVVLHTLAPWLDSNTGSFSGLLTLLATLGLSIGLAMVSYYGLELPFLRRKARLARV